MEAEGDQVEAELMIGERLVLVETLVVDILMCIHSIPLPQELIPILLCVISKHSDARIRDQLLHMMFNLIKRPDRKQRSVSFPDTFHAPPFQSSPGHTLTVKEWETVVMHEVAR